MAKSLCDYITRRLVFLKGKVNMIYITGDTHGEFGRFSKKRIKKKNLELTENDYVIICGDMGLCWAEDATYRYDCDFFAKKPYTTLWVQGNHENYDMIETYPLEEWHGGMVRHIVRDKVILLERGQIFEIEGHTFFTFGGASSHDISGGILDRSSEEFKRLQKKAQDRKLPYRILHESWWPQELPSEAEMKEGIKNLEKAGYKVDYVITHCCASKLQEEMCARNGKSYEADVLNEYLQGLEEKMEYKHWFFGHYHMDLPYFDEKHSAMYYGILRLGERQPVFTDVRF